MNKKILFTASTASHLENFHLPYIKAFEDMGYEVTALALPVSKSFLSVKNIRAVFYAKRLIKKECFDIVSSQSTLAGIVTRLAVFLLFGERKGIRVFHTAHGYLFNDDRNLKKWIYILPEKICGKTTDVLMVMNHEDLDIANKYKLCGRKNNIYYIDGMGIDLNKFQQIPSREEQRKAFGINENDFAFVYAGEFSKRKNHNLLLLGISQAIKESGASEIKLVLAGDGVLLSETKALAKELGISDQVIFLGYVKNIQELYYCCDAAVTTSKIEGLPFNVMEAMACGLPIVASDIKGHKELIKHKENGLLFKNGNQEELSRCLIEIIKNSELKNRCKESGPEKIKQFSIENVLPSIMEIYKNNIER